MHGRRSSDGDGSNTLVAQNLFDALRDIGLGCNPFGLEPACFERIADHSQNIKGVKIADEVFTPVAATHHCDPWIHKLWSATRTGAASERSSLRSCDKMPISVFATGS